jgi:hypothetical protein
MPRLAECMEGNVWNALCECSKLPSTSLHTCQLVTELCYERKNYD